MHPIPCITCKIICLHFHMHLILAPFSGSSVHISACTTFVSLHTQHSYLCIHSIHIFAYTILMYLLIYLFIFASLHVLYNVSLYTFIHLCIFACTIQCIFAYIYSSLHLCMHNLCIFTCTPFTSLHASHPLHHFNLFTFSHAAYSHTIFRVICLHFHMHHTLTPFICIFASQQPPCNSLTKGAVVTFHAM